MDALFSVNAEGQSVFEMKKESLYVCPGTAKAARSAAGGVTEAVRDVIAGLVNSALAAVSGFAMEG